MKVNELRVGNLLLINEKVTEVFGINKYYITHGNIESPCKHELKYFKPIPLTEEWLVKLGFKKENYFTYDNGLISISLPSEDPLLWRNGRTYFNSWKICDAPKYVHNLQNIYFALTGNELQCEGF